MTFVISIPLCVKAQVGEHRDDLSVGVNAGYALSTVGFTPKVSQYQHGGITGGFTVKYVCEKETTNAHDLLGKTAMDAAAYVLRDKDPEMRKLWEEVRDHGA